MPPNRTFTLPANRIVLACVVGLTLGIAGVVVYG